MESEPAATAPDGVWCRLHPVTVLRELAGLAWNLILALILSRGFDGPMGAALELLLPLFVVGFAVARYLSTRYQVNDEAVLFRRGVFVRQRLELRRERIQNVSQDADLFGRMLSMQTVTISSAGSGGEISLQVVSRPEADRIVNQLLGDHQRLAAPPAPEPVHAYGVPVLTGAPPPVGAPVVLAPLVPAVDRRRRYELDFRSYLIFVATGPASVITAIVGAAIGTYVAFTGEWALLFGAFGLFVPLIAAIELFEFRLDVEPDRLRVQHGLISTTEQWAMRERIQVAEIRRPWLRRRVGRVTVAVATADVTVGSGGAFEMCAPLLRSEEWVGLLPDLIEEVDLSEDQLQRVSPRSIRRRFIRGMIGPALIALALLLTSFLEPGGPFSVPRLVDDELIPSLGWGWALVVLALTAPYVFWSARKSWMVDGYVLSDEHAMVRRGRLSDTLHIVRLSKIQNVSLEASFFQRRLGVASLLIDTANLGPGVTVPDMERAEAERFAARLIEVANRSVLPDGV